MYCLIKRNCQPWPLSIYNNNASITFIYTLLIHIAYVHVQIDSNAKAAISADCSEYLYIVIESIRSFVCSGGSILLL